MADGWNLANIEPLNDVNYFLWKEKIEAILRAKKLWKKVIVKKEPEIPPGGDKNFEQGFNIWNEWDNGNHAARAIMINTMSAAQVLKYCKERNAGRLWNSIKHNMAEESEPIKVKALSELTNLKMTREENVDTYINRAEALTNKCAQLGKVIEEYELKMYVMRGLRIEFDQNVRILENQREVTLNEIRYALKQEEERNERRRGERIQRDQEGIRRAKEKTNNETCCFNCGKKGHVSRECYGKVKCFNCQGYGHKSNECNETRNSKPTRGRGQRGRFQRRGHQERYGYGRGRGEAMMSTSEENVMTASERTLVNKTVRSEKNIRDVHVKNMEWLLDSGSTSHMINDTKVFDRLEHDVREITLADKEGRKLISSGIGDVVMKQEQIENRVRLANVLCVPDLNVNLLSVAKFTDFGYTVKFNKHCAEIYKEKDKIQMIAVRKGN
ncbi:uncharacterized protein LOC143219195 [Lasioglossum baleicum]|uniref:uncharacterized protein LOC143219195 n=1 Tax=Lasioglossum baleicum TaxID=434251 RepID=UPI003FCD3A39